MHFDLEQTAPCSDEVLFVLQRVLEFDARLHIILLGHELHAPFVIVLCLSSGEEQPATRKRQDQNSSAYDDEREVERGTMLALTLTTRRLMHDRFSVQRRFGRQICAQVQF